MESAHRYFRIGAPLILDWAHRLTGIRSFCTEIPQTGNLQTNKSRCGADIGNAMQKERNRNHRSRMLPRSYPHAGKDTAEVFCIRNRGVFEGEKFAHDI